VFVAALAVFIVLGQRKKRDAHSIYLPGREPAAESAAADGTETAVEPAGDEAAVEPAGDEAAADTAGNKTAADAGAKEAAADHETTVETAAGAEKTDDVGPSPKPASGRRSAVDPVRDPDPAVSDSEARGNLPDNQNGPGRSSAPTEAAPAPSGGNTSATDSPDTGKSGATATGAVPKADGTR
jgi:hypothetical protein